MKQQLRQLILIITFFPMSANATLLGRVNEYYAQQNTVEIQQAKSAFDEATRQLNKFKNDSVIHKIDVNTAQQLLDDKQNAYEKLLKLNADENITRSAQADIDNAKKTLDIAQNALSADNAKITVAAQDVKTKKDALDIRILSSPKGLSDPSTDGIQTAALSSASISSVTGGGNAVNLNAYQFNVPLWKARCNGKHKAYPFMGSSDLPPKNSLPRVT